MANNMTMTAQLQLDIKNFAANLTAASRQMTKFAAETNKSYGSATAALKSHTMELKSTARIVQGILISQAFYTVARGIREATSTLFEFNEQLDYMKVTYSALFGSTELAQDFMKTLQEHSINTIFEFGELADASKKLLAYGIEYENLMYVMEGLTNLGAMSGDVAAIERAARAIGQIFTKGTLKAEEMKQLADAYIPIYDIVQSSFGLSQEQMGSIGDLKLPAEDVINAIVEYANSKFGGVADAAMMTITGLKNRIVDTFKVLGTEMLEPFTVVFKSFLVYVDRQLSSLRNTFNKSGFGGVFESLVPDPHVQKFIRLFIANLQNLLGALIGTLKLVGTAAGDMFMVLASAFNAVAPILTTLLNSLNLVLHNFLQTSVGATTLRIAAIGAAGALAILTLQTIRATVVSALTAMINGLSKALAILSVVISTLAKTPLGVVLLALTAGLAAIALTSTRANNALSSLFGTMSGAGNTSYEDVLKRTDNELSNGADAANKFNNALGAGSDSADALGDSLDGAGKKAKKASRSLLAFDEVFRLNEPDSDSAGSGIGKGLLDELDGLMGGLGALGDAIMPDIPDFSDFIKDFTDGLFGGLKGSLLDAFTNGNWINPSIFGIGGILGAIAKAFGVGLKGLPKILKELIDTKSLTRFFGSIGDLFKGVGLKEIAKGGLIGIAVGLLMDAIAALLWSTLAEKLNLSADSVGNAAVGQTVGSILGTILGGLLGGPAGALIGSAIGTFAGGFVGLFWDKIKELLAPAANAITDFVATTALQIGKWFLDTLESFTGWMDTTVTGFIEWVAETFAIFSNWDAITVETFTTWITNTLVGLVKWAAETVLGFADWADETTNGIKAWAKDTFGTFINWFTSVYNGLNEWYQNTMRGINNWINESFEAFIGWVGSVLKTFGEWSASALKLIVGFCVAALASFVDWCLEVSTAISDWFFDLIADVKKWWENLWVVKSWKSGWSMISSWFDDLFRDIGGWMSSVRSAVSNWWSSLWEGKQMSVDIGGTPTTGSVRSMPGHATGGIFNREHVARFAEGNRAEAVIPLENATAMQPFVDAISRGILEGLAPTLLQTGTNDQSLPPMYVGTLVADERGLKQLYKKFELIRVQENARTGNA